MASLDSLRSVLELERSKGYTDRAVIGGLDRYLHEQEQGILRSVSDPSLVDQFRLLRLPSAGYASLSQAERERVVARLFEWVAAARTAETRKPSSLTRKPGSAAEGASERGAAPLDSPITLLKGITRNSATEFERLGVRTLYDLLYFFPSRYIDYSTKVSIAELAEGREQTVLGTVWHARVISLGRRKGTEALVGDETGTLRVVWFNQPYLARRLPTNSRIVLSGRVALFRDRKTMESPEWEPVKDRELIHTGRLVPVYPLTGRLRARQVRRWTKQAVDEYSGQLADFLPDRVRRKCQLLHLQEAIQHIHFPDSWHMMERGRERLAFDELFLLQLGVLDKRRDWREGQPAKPIRYREEIAERFLNSLPFPLTDAQKRVLREIGVDIGRTTPMSRLLQGEVGSGKTVVATVALLMAVANGYQGVLMAPTEVLAEQHFGAIGQHLSRPGVAGRAETAESVFSVQPSYVRRFDGLIGRPLTVGLLTGSLKEQEKDEVRTRIAQGDIDIVVGTHAVIQKEVKFSRLGLAVIDEQQRFGVVQRAALRQKGSNPHVLVMTATPIPRTMALTVYADLDLSYIDQLPPGRRVVKTRYLEPEDLARAYAFVQRRVREGEQAFVICPMIDESENLDGTAAVSEHRRLSQDVFPGLRVALLHGRMPPEDKEQVMHRFTAGEIDVLVSTSVVEVGVDVPRATVMLVQGAERFGLSQLHQLRGRVGRRAQQGYCLLVPAKQSPEARERLKLMERLQDGFALAEKDLELRGPGQFLGTHQSGLPELRVAKLTNLRVVEMARRQASEVFSSDSSLEQAEHRLLKQQLSRMWSNSAEWS